MRTARAMGEENKARACDPTHILLPPAVTHPRPRTISIRSTALMDTAHVTRGRMQYDDAYSEMYIVLTVGHAPAARLEKGYDKGGGTCMVSGAPRRKAITLLPRPARAPPPHPPLPHP